MQFARLTVEDAVPEPKAHASCRFYAAGEHAPSAGADNERKTKGNRKTRSRARADRSPCRSHLPARRETMRVLRRPRLLAVLAVAAGLCAAHARAGVNTWTGLGNTASVVAADPHDPYVVYAVFYPGDLVRSADGGRTWTHLATFDVIYSVLVHPAAPNTLYVGAYVMQGNGYGNLFKSSDGGATWTR